MTLYKGRIGKEHGALMDAINRSLPVDIRLLPYDALTNEAWAAELARIGVLSAAEHAAVRKALAEVKAMWRAGAFDPLPADEDVHTLVERLLTEIAGDAGRKIHTGRSRNDQSVCDTRMYACDRLIDLAECVEALIGSLAKMGGKHAASLMPGTTHTQPAQPVTLGFWLLSLSFALARDLERIGGAYERANVCPLGSGALAGSAFPVDRARLARSLSFSRASDNALDATGDRDFAQEIASACAILTGHLSRYADALVVWAAPEFGFVRFDDAWSTGSSMMPQKRNPDAMELVRAKSARCAGDAAVLLALTKGLGPGYSKDLQEDKAALFNALDTAWLCVKVFGEALGSARFNTKAMAAALSGDLLATDLADALAAAGVPFRAAHERVSRFVTQLEAESRTLLGAKRGEIRKHFRELPAGFSLSYAEAAGRRSVEGGTSPKRVREKAAEIARFITGRRLKKRRVRQGGARQGDLP